MREALGFAMRAPYGQTETFSEALLHLGSFACYSIIPLSDALSAQHYGQIFIRILAVLAALVKGAQLDRCVHQGGASDSDWFGTQGRWWSAARRVL